MIDLQQIPGLKRQRPSTVLALSFDGSQMDGVVVRRNGSIQLLQSFSTTLTLDPLTADPELVGREIRNHLDTANVRERDCVVCVPLKWAMTTHTEIPDLPEADIPAFLQIEAERGFHADPETLYFTTSRYSLGAKKHAALFGIPRNHVERLEKVLRAAKLKPLSFSLGLTALQPPASDKSNCVMALLVSESSVGLQISCGGGVAALRTLEGTLEMQGGRRVLHSDVVVREARITLGQLPAELREKIRTVRIFGPRDFAQQLADDLELRLESMSLKIEVVKAYAPGEFGMEIPSDAAVSAAYSFGAEYLTGRPTFVEFLPPKVPAWKQYAEKYGTGRARKAIALASAVAVILIGLFLYQQIQLMRWESKWKQMSSEVGDLKNISAKIDKYQGWSDKNVTGLTILKQITTAFPDSGDVTVKSLEIRDLNTVVCTGVARSMQSLTLTQGQLRRTSGIVGVNLVQSRGHSPSLQFTLNIQYNAGAFRAN
ncbi:MAG TPA: hypothetical protein VHC44_07200 [Verrucomicrobiae bacterium]|nr:hypothetical protein [Verrucomicrobiae bacterium]